MQYYLNAKILSKYKRVRRDAHSLIDEYTKDYTKVKDKTKCDALLKNSYGYIISPGYPKQDIINNHLFTGKVLVRI